MRTSAAAKSNNKKGWVSKTDILWYNRCPYAFWLVDQGEVDPYKITPQFSKRLTTGEAFEASILERLPTVDAEITLEEIFCGTTTVFGIATLQNAKLGLVGRPDGIEPNSGALIPVEIKSHLKVSFQDRLELAFYWTLLEPYRSKKAESRGVVILRSRDGGHEKPVSVELGPVLFERVDALISGVRKAREEGVSPRYCRCVVCASRPEVQSLLRGRQDLKLVLGIATTRKEVLEGGGIHTMDDLLAMPTEKIRHLLRESRHFVSETEINRWKHHVRAYRENRLVRIEDSAFKASDFIALDFEYISEANDVWLIGCRIDIADKYRVEQFWADTKQERNSAFEELGRILEANPTMPVITWSGRSAEAVHVPHLAKIGRRDDIAEQFFCRHVDLYEIALRSFRIPVPTLRLSDVAEYAGFRFTSEVKDGFEATGLYFDYRDAHSDEKVGIRTALLEYNRDDLDALATIAKSLFAGS